MLVRIWSMENVHMDLQTPHCNLMVPWVWSPQVETTALGQHDLLAESQAQQSNRHDSVTP